MFILPQVFTAKKYNMPVSFGSFNEVPLIFIKCGGDLDMDSSTYGRVPLENVLLFFNGDTPLKSNNLQTNQINFGTVSPPTKLAKMFPYFQMVPYPSHILFQMFGKGGAMSFTPPGPAPPAKPIEAIEASGSYATDGSANRAQLAWIGLTLMAALSQLPVLIYKVATQIFCPAHWGKNKD